MKCRSNDDASALLEDNADEGKRHNSLDRQVRIGGQHELQDTRRSRIFAAKEKYVENPFAGQVQPSHRSLLLHKETKAEPERNRKRPLTEERQTHTAVFRVLFLVPFCPRVSLLFLLHSI